MIVDLMYNNKFYIEEKNNNKNLHKKKLNI